MVTKVWEGKKNREAYITNTMETEIKTEKDTT